MLTIEVINHDLMQKMYKPALLIFSRMVFDTCSSLTLSASDVPPSPFLALLPQSFNSSAAHNAVGHAVQAANGLVTALNVGIGAINRAYAAYNEAGGGSGGAIAQPPSGGGQVSKVQGARNVAGRWIAGMLSRVSLPP